MTNPGERRLWELVERAARNVTDGEGYFTSKELADEIASVINDDDPPAHVRQSADRRLAESLAVSFVAQRNPKPRAQGVLYHHDAVLKLGHGKRVWARHATDDDVLSWAGLSTENLARVATAEGARQRYAASRIQALREHPGMRLGDVEREVFGYSPDPDDDFGDDGDLADPGLD